MDWMSLLGYFTPFLATTTVGGVYYAIKYRKQNKKLKNLEVEKSQLENETTKLENEAKKMQLGNDYLEKMKEAADLLYESSQKSDNNWKEMKTAMSLFETRLDSFEKILQQVVENQNNANEKIANLEAFENGKYQEFLRNQEKKTNKKNNVKRKPKDSE